MHHKNSFAPLPFRIRYAQQNTRHAGSDTDWSVRTATRTEQG